ncbi:MAG: enamine deaminase RidA (YjgF/YER057c/UK114 family)/aromatic ring-opening dioxygenase LigB subunit [Planctomycetota bacterium]|jgi:enamine deaminase RidA (YjgF/YER057c/UK114 family)/aromatic ring-opening dioxygenase LigB subunit
MSHPVVKGLVVPGLPQPLLTPEANEGYGRLRDAFGKAREEIAASGADVLIVYSTMWPSIIGHQIQALPEPEWVHVDEQFHDLGSIPYKFKIDTDLAGSIRDSAHERGLSARTIAYEGFPIDTGSVVALKMLNPNNELPAVILSSNVYADRSESVVFGKSVVDALEAQGKKAVVVVVMTLSNRLFTKFIDPKDDRIHSGKDEEWNQKLLEFFGEGRLEDVAQLSREIHKQIRIPKVVNFKPMWWMSAVMGAHNNYKGEVLAYAPLYGTGGAVISLTPAISGIGTKEFDEADVEVFAGSRDVLSGVAAGPEAGATTAVVSQTKTKLAARAGAAPIQETPDGEPDGALRTDAAPKPVGAYPHARRVGDLLFLSGVGPRQAADDSIPGGPIHDTDGKPLNYDVYLQTKAVIGNIEAILKSSGSSLANVLDITVFLVDMDRDFSEFNRAYAETFEGIGAARTTIAIRALPTPIAVEFKVLAAAGDA